ncbi:transposase [Methylocystis sp. MJC1]|uniref:transposase n=1 Tax=Methylocystis sp. MJC1 TaxID=2654282 RepID=UPI0034D4E41C
MVEPVANTRIDGSHRGRLHDSVFCERPGSEITIAQPTKPTFGLTNLDAAIRDPDRRGSQIVSQAYPPPTGFHLTPGQAHDLEGADALLPGLGADALLADKAYDADERVIEPSRHAEIEPVIPTKANRKEPRPHDKDLYKARSLIENFRCKLKQSRGIATRQNSSKFSRRDPPSPQPSSQLMTGPRNHGIFPLLSKYALEAKEGRQRTQLRL